MGEGVNYGGKSADEGRTLNRAADHLLSLEQKEHAVQRGKVCGESKREGQSQFQFWRKVTAEPAEPVGIMETERR